MTAPLPQSVRPWAVSRWNAPVLVLFALYVASCSGDVGPERVAVHGAVRLDGAPLPAGQIRFIPTEGTSGPAAAAEIKDGEFAFTEDDGPIVGTHRVEIEATDYLGFAIDDERAFAQFARSGGTRDRRRTQNPVPPEYNRQSKLVRTIDRESEPVIDFELEPAPPPKK